MNAPVLSDIKAYSYIRFSTPKQALGDSLRRQADKAAKYAAEHGLTLDTELKLTDAGVSGFRGANVKTGALGAFLEGVRTGVVPAGSYLLIENMDRLTRSDILEATALFAQIISAGISLVTLTNGEVWSTERLKESPYGMIEVTIDLIRGNQESARKSQLVGDAKARKKEILIAGGARSKPYTRQTPGWLKWDDATSAYLLIPERAALVREIFERTDAGHGIDRIAKDLNARNEDTWGGRNRKADHWRGSYMRKILLSTAPIGTFTPHVTMRDKVTGARRDKPMTPVVNLFPAVVAQELYWKVNRRFATRAARGRHAKHGPKSIVAGIMQCAGCGASVTRVSKGAHVYLVCSRANMRAKGCKYLAVPYRVIEEALRQGARALIKGAPRGKSTTAIEKQINGLQVNADRLESETFELVDLVAQSKSPAARKRLREKEAELEGAQAALRNMRKQRDTLTTAGVRLRLTAVSEALTCATNDVSATNQALRQAIARITMAPETGTLEFQWHHSEETQELLFHSKHFRWDAKQDWATSNGGEA